MRAADAHRRVEHRRDVGEEHRPVGDAALGRSAGARRPCRRARGATIVVPIAGSSTPSRANWASVERAEAGDRRRRSRRASTRSRPRRRCVAPTVDQRRAAGAERRAASATKRLVRVARRHDERARRSRCRRRARRRARASPSQTMPVTARPCAACRRRPIERAEDARRHRSAAADRPPDVPACCIA